VQGCFTFNSAIPHEAARFNGWFGGAVGIRAMAEEHFEHTVMGKPIGCAESRMQRGLSGIRQGLIHVGALLNQKLTQLPMSVKSGAIEIEILSQRLDGLSIGN